MYVSQNGNRESGKIRRGAITGRLGEVYTPPGTPILTTQADSRDTYLVQQMHALSQQIYDAKQRKDVAEVQRLLAQFQPLADEYRERGSIGVSPFDTFIVATGNWINQTLAAVPGAIAAPLGAVGEGLIRGLLPFAAIALAFAYIKKKL